MGLLDRFERKALQRAEKRLGPLMREGERIVTWEIGYSGINDAEIHLIATERAVYAYNRKTDKAVRLPYQAFDSVRWLHISQRPGRRESGLMILEGAGGWTWDFIVESRGDFDSFVTERVETLRTAPIFERHVEVAPDGLGATVRFRQTSDDVTSDQAFIWVIEPDESLELTPDRDAAIRDACMKLRPEALRAKHDRGH